MHFYHVRFNTYRPDEPPQEKEDWLQLELPRDDHEMKALLEATYSVDITIISSQRVSEEIYKEKVNK